MENQVAAIEPLFTLSVFERYLSQQGNFCLLDWFLQENIIHYSAYEAWRYGKQETLDDALRLTHSACNKIMLEVEQHAKSLNLAAEPHDYFLWIENNQHKLQASKVIKIDLALTQHWLRAQDLPQLDLFLDNSSVICENEIHLALAARQFELAQKKLQQLITLNAKHANLGSYQDLINYGLHMQKVAVQNLTNLKEEIIALEKEVIPLARHVIANYARDYLAFAWRRLSYAAQQLGFHAEEPMLDASYSLMQIPDWQAALQHLHSLSYLWKTPILLQRLALCYERLLQHSEALVTWCLLFECDQQATEVIIENKESLVVWNLWQDFEEINDAGMKSFFPAFVLIKNPGLLHHLNKFPALTSPSSNAMISLLKVRLEKGNEIEAREQVQHISPALLRLYLHAR